MEEVEKRIKTLLVRRTMQEKLICEITRVQGKHLKLIVCQGRKSTSQGFSLRCYNMKLLASYKPKDKKIYKP